MTVPGELAADAAAIVSAVTGRPIDVQDAAIPPGAAPRARILGDLDPGDESDTTVALLVARLEALEGRYSGARFELEREEHLVEEDRGAAHPDQFHPFTAAPGLVIAPPWEPCDPRPGERVITIDPGPAFGSGFHASTRLALALVAKRCAAAAPRRMLDVGTGTGVLALAGAVWDVAEVLAVDSDPEAVAAARANVSRNGRERQVRVASGGLGEVAGVFDLIVANITVDVLAALAGALAGRLDRDGALVLSGVLAGGQEVEIRAVYERQGLRCETTRSEGEWIAMLLLQGAAGTSVSPSRGGLRA